MIPSVYPQPSKQHPCQPASFLARTLLLARALDFSSRSPMASFGLLKFWKQSSARVSGYADSVFSPAAVSVKAFDVCEEVVEEDDSFFEMEFALPAGDQKSEPTDDRASLKTCRIEDFISNDKAEVRISAKPLSPRSILRQSAPVLRFFTFGKKSPQMRRSSGGGGDPADEKQKTEESLTVKPNTEDSGIAQKRADDYDDARINGGAGKEFDRPSGRFSKDSIQKCLNFIKKPLQVKLSGGRLQPKRKSDQGESFASAGTAPLPSPRKSEEKANINCKLRAPLQNLGKSRSAGALLVGASSPSSATGWKDDTLAQQNDGIQSAILYCKRSFNSRQGIQAGSSIDNPH